MSSKTIKGDISDLDLLKEHTINFKALLENNLSKIHSDILFQNWNKYFEMLFGPIFPDLVKEFWANAHIQQNGLDDCVILSVVSGFPVMINSYIISQAIECEEAGKTVESFRGNNLFANHMHLIYGYEGPDTSPSTLTSMAKVWYQIMGTNLRPREKGAGYMSAMDKLFILFLISKIKINLPKSIFNYLKEEIISSREKLSFQIPYSRVISHIFHLLGVVSHIKQAGLTKNLVVDWCPPMNYSEIINLP